MFFAKPVRIVLILVVVCVTTIIGCGVDSDNPGSGSISIKKESLKGAELKKNGSQGKTEAGS